MSGVSLKNLQKKFGDFTAIDNINLDIDDGDFAVLLGPSGCGKSTTLNCIAGLEAVTSGKIFLKGRDVTDLPPHQRDIAMVFQSSLLYPHLSARQNILMSLRHSNIEQSEIDRRFDHAVNILQIGGQLDKKPDMLSGGERQRVAMAKAIVRDPVVFLMDEPLAALDAALRLSLRSEVVHLQKHLGTTTVFVTHDQVEAMTMGDVVVVMNNTRIEQVGSPDEIYNNPHTRFVAKFIGSPPMNFFKGNVTENKDILCLHYEGTDFRLPEKLKQNAGSGVHYLGVRPQHVTISENSRTGSVPMEVYALERLGKENIVILRNSSGETFRVIVDPSVNCTIGDNVFIQPDMEHAYLFNE